MQVVTSIAILIVDLSIGYYFVIFIPQKEAFQQEQLKKTAEMEQEIKNEKSNKEQLYRSCETEAAEKAKETAKDKMELMEGTAQYTTYKEAVDKGMYLKDDYNDYYERCLR